MAPAPLSDLDLSALLCSRVCHDIIAPMQAITMGFDVYDDEGTDEQTREMVLQTIRGSSGNIAAKLSFSRIAFGAAGSAGESIDLNAAGKAAGDFFAHEKTRVEWDFPPEHRPKLEVKLVLNMMLLGKTCIPRGGLLIARGKGLNFTVRAQGERARVDEKTADLAAGHYDPAAIDARAIQPYYAHRLADALGTRLTMAMDGADAMVAAAP